MSEFIHLLGADDVSRAGSRIQNAANDMIRAASSIDDSLHRQRIFIDDWLMRLETLFQEQTSNLKEEGR